MDIDTIKRRLKEINLNLIIGPLAKHLDMFGKVLVELKEAIKDNDNDELIKQLLLFIDGISSPLRYYIPLLRYLHPENDKIFDDLEERIEEVDKIFDSMIEKK